MQVKLLRAIQEKRIRPIGSDKEIPIDVRILSATHKDLQHEVANANFRQDLFFRINVIQISVPSLRERKDDIPLLVEYFLKQLNQGKTSSTVLSEDAMRALINYSFPGNVRELENILERAYTLCENHIIQTTDLNLPSLHHTVSDTESAPISPERPYASSVPSMPYKTSINDAFLPNIVHPEFKNFDQYIEDIERAVLEQALTETRWNKTATAHRLGISFRQLRYKLKKLGMD